MWVALGAAAGREQRRAHEDEQSGAEQGEGCAQAHGCHHLSVGLCGVGWIGWVVRVGC